MVPWRPATVDGAAGRGASRRRLSRARYYDANVGRFLSQDSYLGELGAPATLHRYLYGGASPARYSDPTGHWLLDDAENKVKSWRAAVNKEAGELANSANVICGADGSTACRGATNAVAGTAAFGAFGFAQFALATGEFALKGVDYFMEVGAVNVSLVYQNEITDQAREALREENSIIASSVGALGQAATWGKIFHGVARTAKGMAEGNTSAWADAGEAFFTFGTGAAALGKNGWKLAQGMAAVAEKGVIAVTPMLEAAAEMVVTITREPAAARAVVREAAAIASAAVCEQFTLARGALETATVGLRRMGAGAVSRSFVTAFAGDLRQGLRADLTGGIASTVKATGAGVKAVVRDAFESGKAAQVAESGAAAKYQAWANDLDKVSGTVERLGRRALKYSGGDWRRSEALFERYLGGVENRLARNGSRFGVEIQPAAVVGEGRVPNFVQDVFPNGNPIPGTIEPFPGSRRLDAGIVDRLRPVPSRFGGAYHEVVAGFDITLNQAKRPIIQYYQEAFGQIPIYDIR